MQALGSPTFRPYHTTDVRGVEIGGAAKNVLAIAAGIAVGRKLGASAQAALTTRGFSELARLRPRLWRAQRNLVGLSGLGDLILTCSSPQSRNFALGIALGRGEPPPPGKLAEGSSPRRCWSNWRLRKTSICRYQSAVAAILSARSSPSMPRSRRLLTRPVQGGGMTWRTGW